MHMKTLNRRIGLYFGKLCLADDQLNAAYPMKTNKMYHFITKPFYEESVTISIGHVISVSQISRISNRKAISKEEEVLYGHFIWLQGLFK